MSLEFWLWFAAWVVLSEMIFVIWYYIDDDKWVRVKLMSFLLGAAFMALQHLISNFLYEFYIILAIGLFIGANYGIVKLIDKIKKKKKKRW